MLGRAAAATTKWLPGLPDPRIRQVWIACRVGRYLARPASTPTPESPTLAVDRLLKMSKGRSTRSCISRSRTSSSRTGLEASSGLQELRALGRYMQQQTSVLVALSAPMSPECSTLEPLYANGVGDLVTVHFGPRDRRTGRDVEPGARALEAAGVQAPSGAAQQQRADWAVFHGRGRTRSAPHCHGCGGDVCIPGVGSYVLHTGAGVRGGGRADLERGRPANVSDVPNIQTILQGLENVRRRLPAEIPNWTQIPCDRNEPVHCDRAGQRGSGIWCPAGRPFCRRGHGRQG